MPEFRDKVTFPDARAVRATDRALLVEIVRNGEYVEIWFPASQIDDDSEVYREGDTGKLIVSPWIVEQKGLL